MKKQVLTLALLFVASVTLSAQTTRIVDNNPNGIGDFTTLTAAISAASAGDIILLVPSATSYGNLSLTSTGKKLTIAGGGANGATGLYTKLGAISLNGGSANNTNLDGFVLGGFECESIDVNFVDSVKIKAVKTTAVITSTNYQLRVRSSVGAEIEYIDTRNTLFQSNTGLKIYHTIIHDAIGYPGIDIQSTTDFIVSNSFIKSGGVYVTINSATLGNVIVDANSSGMFNNNVFFFETGYNRSLNFGGAVSVTNNIIYRTNTWPSQGITILGGQLYQNNTFYNPAGGNFIDNQTSNGLLTLSGSDSDANGNVFVNPKINITDQNTFTLELTDGSTAIDSGSGNDLDGTVADRGVFGGLDPMPKPMPNTAVGVSVVPSVTSLKLSLPTAVSGGKVILNVTGQSKKN